MTLWIGPDAGPRVFVFKEKTIPPGVHEYSTLDTFRVVNSSGELQQIYKIVNQEMFEQEKEPMKKCGIKTEEDFEDLDRRAFTIIRKIKSQGELRTTVDVNGNFSITIPPGPPRGVFNIDNFKSQDRAFHIGNNGKILSCKIKGKGRRKD